jgi:hypothetical protein
MSAWLFQADESYKLQREIIKGHLEVWDASVQLEKMHKGDKVVLWQSGKAGGVYGFGHLHAAPSPSRRRVQICYDRQLDQPIFKSTLRRHPVLRNLLILRMPRWGNPSIVRDREYQALADLIENDRINIFNNYAQEENCFTNGLISLLDLSRTSGEPLFKAFFVELLNFQLAPNISKCRVLAGMDGSTVDAELCGKDIRVRIETKIESGTLRKEQLRRHLRYLTGCPERTKVLIVLTPDDTNSDFIQGFLDSFRSRKHRVVHLEWQRVYEFLSRRTKGRTSVFREVAFQYLRRVHDRIFDQDFGGIIQKISFGPTSGVDAETYLGEIKSWRYWDTPRKYEKLVGTGRRLLLYDRTKQAITAAAEIRSVKRTSNRGSFPFRNTFAGSAEVLKQQIPLAKIREIPGFENFGKKGDRPPYRNITREQCRQLGVEDSR